MTNINETMIPVGTKALILSKFYYGVLSKSLENIDSERYYAILYFLSENNGCNQQCICNNLAIDKTAMVKVIDYLMKTDMVERDINPEDRRQHFIKLTKKGLRQTQEIVKAFKAIDNQIFSNISNDDKETFTRVLSQLSSNLKNLPANDLFFNYKKTARKRRTNNFKI